jgi:translation initiation factor 4A
MELNTPQVIILSPTRELAIQNANVVKALGSMMNGLKVMTLVGGSSIDEDIHTLKKNPPHIISGCPGRVYDMFRRRCIPTQHLKLLILDEADEMLSTGFKEQVQSLFQHLPETMQVALFSATLPQSIHDISKKIMRNPVEIFVKAESLTLEGISQFYVAVQDDRQKYETLKDIFSFISMSQCIIYCNTVQRVMDLYDSMTKDQFPVCCIHSNMDKTEREKAFNEFLTGKHRVLISSNVTARGIDIQQVSVVINFDLPNCVHTYLHRIGRSGRWGRKGVSINFITRRDMEKIREIETFYSTQIKELTSNLDTLFT